MIVNEPEILEDMDCALEADLEVYRLSFVTSWWLSIINQEYHHIDYVNMTSCKLYGMAIMADHFQVMEELDFLSDLLFCQVSVYE